MGPMTAAVRFLARLADAGVLDSTARVEVTLYGSLALTGRGHATDRAVMLGLMGYAPRHARSRRGRRGDGRARAVPPPAAGRGRA